MKHQEMASAARELLAELGVEYNDEGLECAVSHLEWVLQQNKQLNLTSITDPATAVRLHLVDSLAALPYVNKAPAGPLCDMGTGAGYPGLPLSIMSGRSATLVDSVGKKARALEGFIAERHLDSRVHTSSQRLEELAVHDAGRFAVITARALSQLPSLVELAAPLLELSGVLIAMKAIVQDGEVAAGDKAAEVVGLLRTDVVSYVLPIGSETRTLVIYTKVGEPRIALPRRVGLAQKRPLG